MGWVIGIGAILLIALFLTRTQVGRMIVGAIYPAPWLAAQIIRERLTEQRLNPHLLPISALAHHSVDFAKMQARVRTQPSQKPGQKPWYRTFLLQSAQTTADTVFFVSMGNPSDWSAAEIKAGVDRDMPDAVWQILAKYDPKRFALENLEKTQMINRALLADTTKT